MPTAKLLAAELLKVRKRWLPYLLLLAMAAFLSLHLWLAGYLSWRLSDGREEQESLRIFVLPLSLPGMIETLQFWGAVLVGVLAASMVATEHAWGTVRQALVRGQTRTGYLTTKLAGIAIVGGIAFLFMFIVGLVFSIIATALADQPLTLDLPSGGSVSVIDIAFMLLRAMYTMTPYVLLAFCLTVVGRSTTLGVVSIVLFVIIEGIVVGILGSIGGATADVRGYFLGHNVTAVLAANRVDSEAVNSLALRGSPLGTDLPDPAVAALVLALYSAAFLLIAYWVFLRRDLHD